MIYETSFHQPTKEQVRLIKLNSDDSFCMNVDADFNPPAIAGFTFCRHEMTGLAMKCVEPHEDPWVGSHEEGDTGNGPPGRRAAFWLIATQRYHDPILQVGTMSARMKSGTLVIFDDRILHSVISMKKWWGLAYQLRPVA